MFERGAAAGMRSSEALLGAASPPLLRQAAATEEGALAMVLATRIEPLLVRVADANFAKGVHSSR
jgi:hypothetical protein